MQRHSHHGIVHNLQEGDEHQLFHIKGPGVAPPIEVQVELDERTLTMEVDTGASLSLVSEETFRNLWPNKQLLPPNVKLCSYTGEQIVVLGGLDVAV